MGQMLGIQLGNSAGAIFTCILSIGFSFFGSWFLAVVLLGGVGGGGVVGSKEVLGFTAMPSPKAAASPRLRSTARMRRAHEQKDSTRRSPHNASIRHDDTCRSAAHLWLHWLQSGQLCRARGPESVKAPMPRLESSPQRPQLQSAP